MVKHAVAEFLNLLFVLMCKHSTACISMLELCCNSVWEKSYIIEGGPFIYSFKIFTVIVLLAPFIQN